MSGNYVGECACPCQADFVVHSLILHADGGGTAYISLEFIEVGVYCERSVGLVRFRNLVVSAKLEGREGCGRERLRRKQRAIRNG